MTSVCIYLMEIIQLVVHLTELICVDVFDARYHSH